MTKNTTFELPLPEFNVMTKEWITDQGVNTKIFDYDVYGDFMFLIALEKEGQRRRAVFILPAQYAN